MTLFILSVISFFIQLMKNWTGSHKPEFDYHSNVSTFIALN